jgi:hypothetical protein
MELLMTDPQSRRQPVIFRRTLILLIGWILLLGMLSVRGFFTNFSALPPRIGLAALLPLPAVLLFSFSKRGREILRQIPPQRLIYWQSFRIVVEIILWISVLNGLLPSQLSFEGRNFDILTGVFAFPIGYYCYVKRSWPAWLVTVYNVGGLLLLLNAVLVSMLSMPTPIRVFHNEPSSALLGTFPFIYLPGVLVPLAYTLHIWSLRQGAILRKQTADMSGQKK